MATKIQVISAVRETLADQGIGDFSDETLFSWIGRTTSVKKAVKKVAGRLADENENEAVLVEEERRADELTDEKLNADIGKTWDRDARVKALMEDDERAPLTREEAEDLVDEEIEAEAEAIAGSEAVADEEEEPKKEVGVVPSRYKAIYRENGDATCCGDEMSQLLKAFTTVQGPKGKPYCSMDALAIVAEANELGERLAKYRETLNPGMCRMNIGNLMRGMVSREELVTIGNHVFNYVEDDENEGDGIESPAS